MDETFKELEMLMRYGDKVEYEGGVYIISAVILRGRMIVAREMKEPVLQVELMDLKSNSVIITRPSEIKIILE